MLAVLEIIVSRDFFPFFDVKYFKNWTSEFSENSYIGVLEHAEHFKLLFREPERTVSEIVTKHVTKSDFLWTVQKFLLGGTSLIPSMIFKKRIEAISITVFAVAIVTPFGSMGRR